MRHFHRRRFEAPLSVCHYHSVALALLRDRGLRSPVVCRGRSSEISIDRSGNLSHRAALAVIADRGERTARTHRGESEGGGAWGNGGSGGPWAPRRRRRGVAGRVAPHAARCDAAARPWPAPRPAGVSALPCDIAAPLSSPAPYAHAGGAARARLPRARTHTTGGNAPRAGGAVCQVPV